MAIAGWLVIGIALLILVAVVNNSWRPLLDQFRGALSGVSGSGAPPAAEPEPADGQEPAPFAQSGIPEGSSRTVVPPNGVTVPDPSTAPLPPNNQVVMPGAPPAVMA